MGCMVSYGEGAMHFSYVNPQERKPQAQRDWLDLL